MRILHYWCLDIEAQSERDTVLCIGINVEIGISVWVSINQAQAGQHQGGDNSPPFELSYFPEQGKVKGSERYIRGGILGHAFLDKGLICDYRIGDKNVSAFLAFFPSKKAAEESYSQHMAFLQESGESSPLNGIGDRGLISQEPYHNTIIIVQ